MSETKKTREIDLFDLFASIGRGIKNLFTGLFDALMWCLFFAVKKYKILLIFVVLGLVYGIFKVSTGRNYYSSNMLIRSNAVSSFELKIKLDEFNNFFAQANEFSDKVLREELNMDSISLSNIKGINSYYGIDLNADETIEYFDLKENHNLSDTINIRDKNYLLVQAEIYDPTVLPEFQKNFISYLNRQPLLVKENKQRLENIKKLIDGYDLEIMYLDSFQKVNYFTPNQPSISMEQNQILLGEARKQFVHGAKFAITEDKDEIISDYTVFSDPVTVINDFSLAVKQENSSLFGVIKDVIIFGLFGFIVLVVWYFLSKISGKYLSRIE